MAEFFVFKREYSGVLTAQVCPSNIIEMNNKVLKKRSPADNNGNTDTALLLIDVISDFDFEDGDKLHRHAVLVIESLAKLKVDAQKAGVPVIYVNDNYGNWQDDLQSQVGRIIDSSPLGRQIAEPLRPGPDDYYVLKPQRSGFYETPLEVLLASFKVSKVIVAGFTTDICVLFTAHDAYMRGFSVSVPSDCCAAVEAEYHESALALLKRVAKADLRPSSEITFNAESKKKGAHS